jgi:hypothetical protein
MMYKYYGIMFTVLSLSVHSLNTAPSVAQVDYRQDVLRQLRECATVSHVDRANQAALGERAATIYLRNYTDPELCNQMHIEIAKIYHPVTLDHFVGELSKKGKYREMMTLTGQFADQRVQSKIAAPVVDRLKAHINQRNYEKAALFYADLLDPYPSFKEVGLQEFFALNTADSGAKNRVLAALNRNHGHAQVYRRMYSMFYPAPVAARPVTPVVVSANSDRQLTEWGQGFFCGVVIAGCIGYLYRRPAHRF